jgi:hypothetical protein
MMNSLHKFQKYIIFLKPIYFKKTFIISIYNKIKTNLENKGIVLYNIDHQMNGYTLHNKKLMFDDSSVPNINTLYIHLFDNLYYSYNLYNKKQIEREREILYLLAWKLGVKSINYETYTTQITISDALIKLKNSRFGTSNKYNKTLKYYKGIKGVDNYTNSGAELYLKYNNIVDVEKYIETNMNSYIFNYNFYKTSHKLKSFVHKRFEYKMQQLDYIIETEDISDLYFSVRACFAKYGLDIIYINNVSYNKKVYYELIFYTDDELKKEFINNNNNIQFEKKECNELDKLQTQLEYNNSISSISSISSNLDLELQLNNLIKNCNPNNEIIKKNSEISLEEDEYISYSLKTSNVTPNNIDTNIDINIDRLPIFPASSTISINSVFETENVLFPNFPPPPPPPPSLSSDA